jgi:hypothetical protein
MPIYFNFRMHYQRPYIRRCLETGAHHDGEAVRQAAAAAHVENGWRFVVTRGLAWGALTTGIVAVTSGLQAPWYVVLPLACVAGLVWSTFMLWLRKRLT